MCFTVLGMVRIFGSTIPARKCHHLRCNTHLTVFFQDVCHPMWACVGFNVTADQMPISGVSLGVAKSSWAMSVGRSNRVDNTSTCRNTPM